MWIEVEEINFNDDSDFHSICIRHVLLMGIYTLGEMHNEHDGSVSENNSYFISILSVI